MANNRSTPRRALRGLTLLELVVGVFIAVFLTAAAVAFAAHETKLMGVSRDRLDMSQSSRAALDLLASDLAMAGGGIGFNEAGVFQGLEVGTFSRGSCNCNQSGANTNFDPPVPVPGGSHTLNTYTSVGSNDTAGATYQLPTQDILVRYADGSYATIANYAGAGGQYCASPTTRFGSGELALLRTEAGDRFSAVRVFPGAVGPCAWGQCANGCVNFTITNTTELDSSASASGARFIGGEIAGGLKTVLWFVAQEPADPVGRVTGSLRRAEFNQPAMPCPARDNTLGGVVAENVEAMYIQVYQYITDPAIANPPRWVNMGQSNLNGRNRFRTRADIEVVMRTRHTLERPTMPVRPMLYSGVCAPSTGTCNQPQDFGEREIYRTSVEIKNAGL